MSCDLVFEILCEQLPTKTLDSAREYLSKSVDIEFRKNFITCTNPRVLVSPNRISFLATDFSGQTSSGGEEIKGPRVGSDSRAILGFLKKVGGHSVDDFEVRTVNGVDYYYASTSKTSDNSLSDILRDILQSIIDKFPLHKRMRWGSGSGEWVRPVLNVACVLSDAVIPVQVAGVEATNYTYGNLRFSKVKHTIESVDGYLQFLSKNKVILDHVERRKVVLDLIASEIRGKNLTFNPDDKILDDFTGMLEFPKVLIGNIGESFWKLPKEVILCVLTRHQRYLALYDMCGQIVKFACVVSAVNERVIQTHEVVLSARLSDAAFLIEKDKQCALDDYVRDLDNIVFKKELGTVLDKVNRISALAKYTALWIPHASVINVERSATLCKADLATLLVKEFPELQGVVGRYYAKESGESEDVCRAIEEHYLPVNVKDNLPCSPVGVAVSIADKLDSLVGLMATERASGSSDPFALRRLSISIIRIIMENRISLPLDLIIKKSASLYASMTKKNKALQSLFLDSQDHNLTDTIFSFFIEKLKGILSNEGIDKELVGIISNTSFDLLLIREKAKAIGLYLKSAEGSVILSAYRRIKNIIPKNVTVKEIKIMRIVCNNRLCVEECEMNLFKKVSHCRKILPPILKACDFTAAMNILLELSTEVNNFIDGVRILDEKRVEMYKNRLNLSMLALNLYNSVIDFSKIQKEISC